MPDLSQKLSILIGATDGASKVLDGIKKTAGDTLGEAGLGKYAKAGAVAVAAVGTAAIAAGGALFAIAKSVSDVGDQFAKMSQRTGVSSEDLSTLAFAAERSGTNIGSLETGLRKLAVGMQDAQMGTGGAREAFKALGIQTTDNNGRLRGTQEILLEVADRFKLMTNDTDKAAVAVKLFGRSGTELIPLLNEGSKGIQALQGRARDLGIEFSQRLAKDSEVFNDALTDVQMSFTGIKNTIGASVMPVMSELMNDVITPGIVTVRKWVEGSGMITTVWTEAVNFFKANIIPTLTKFSAEVLVPAMPVLKEFFVNTWALAKPLLEVAWAIIRDGLIPTAKTLIEVLTPAIQTVSSALKMAGDGWKAIASTFSGSTEAAKVASAGIVAEATALPARIEPGFKKSKEVASAEIEGIETSWSAAQGGIVMGSGSLFGYVGPSFSKMRQAAIRELDQIPTHYQQKVLDQIRKDTAALDLKKELAGAIKDLEPVAETSGKDLWNKMFARLDVEHGFSDRITSQLRSGDWKGAWESVGSKWGDWVGSRMGNRIDAKLQDLFGTGIVGQLLGAAGGGLITNLANQALTEVSNLTTKGLKALGDAALDGLKKIGNLLTTGDTSARDRALAPPGPHGPGGVTPQVEGISFGAPIEGPGNPSGGVSDPLDPDNRIRAGKVAAPSPAGGFVGGSPTNLYFTFHIQTVDTDGMRRLVDGELGNLIVARIRRDAEAGHGLIYSSGVINPAYV